MGDLLAEGPWIVPSCESENGTANNENSSAKPSRLKLLICDQVIDCPDGDAQDRSTVGLRDEYWNYCAFRQIS